MDKRGIFAIKSSYHWLYGWMAPIASITNELFVRSKKECGRWKGHLKSDALYGKPYTVPL
ncbi:hypothetical protein DVH24_023369 [Malus domestica]|uniref:Uncharacterized protein n=1 Tax=Malus domestica TaxID=3750 RepID=A0A498KN51_MALDO|nr:hypothetical protein DVH24_023369 [Malus domestica]